MLTLTRPTASCARRRLLALLGALSASLGLFTRRRLLALLGALSASLGLFTPGGLLTPRVAEAVLVYGSPRALAGAGGCLRDPQDEPATDQICPGDAAGLAGAQAVVVTPDGANVYVAGEGAVVTLARNRRTGGLSPALLPSTLTCVASSTSSVCGAKDAALSGADALAVSPDGRFVYVGAANGATVSAFARGPHGVLVPLPRSVGAYAACVTGEPLAAVPPPPCAAHAPALRGVDALAISPDGRYLYAVSSGFKPGTDSVVTLQRDPASGGLRPVPASRGCVQSLPGSGCRALPGLEGASAITISANGRFVYVASELSGAVRAFRRNPVTGGLAPLYGRGGCISSGKWAEGDEPCGVTLPALAGARSLALSPDGRELYVAAFEPGAVVVLARNPATGLLRPQPGCLQAFADANCPVALSSLRGAAALAIARGGRVVFVASEEGNSLVELLRDPADGALTPVSESATTGSPLSGPAAIAISPGGGNIYLASPFDNGVAALVRDGT